MGNNKEIKDNGRKENIQQRPDHIDDKNKKPATPEPPQISIFQFHLSPMQTEDKAFY